MHRCPLFVGRRPPIRSAGLLIAAGLVLAAAAPRESRAQDEPSLPAKEKFHLFVLAGQSNMAGRGKVTEADRQPHPRVLMLTKELKWAPAVAPLHFDKPIAGVGLGRSFAMAVAESDPEITIGLIPCAVGGSPIETWAPGAHDKPTNTHPWDDAVKRMRAAAPHGVFRAVLWHQGESDANAARAPQYQQRLDELVGRFRKELNAPELPFIAGQMGRFADRPWDSYRTQIDQVHQQLPQRLPHCKFVSAEGLQHKGDKVHFNADSYRELGQRYAKAYLK